MLWEKEDVAAKKKSTKTKKSTITKLKVSKPKNGVQYSQAELYEQIQVCCGLDSKRVAKDVYLSFAQMVQVALKKGYKIPLPGLGKIQVRQTKARMGRNPATGEPIRIKAKKRVRLTPNKALKDAVL